MLEVGLQAISSARALGACLLILNIVPSCLHYHHCRKNVISRSCHEYAPLLLFANVIFVLSWKDALEIQCLDPVPKRHPETSTARALASVAESSFDDALRCS